jgi:predicted AAA+ superfamily ATPase
LFGARATGKSTLLRQQLPASSAWYDLLDRETEDRLSRYPNALKDELNALPKSVQQVVIDEVQKLPGLLNTVQELIDKKRFRFALTGSSARKLRHGAVNLLGGRARIRTLFPLTHREVGNDFSLERALVLGTLPEAQLAPSPEDAADYLRGYVLSYLKDEIQAEQIVRRIEPFRAFIEVAAQCNGDVINYAKVARDTSVDDKTIRTYFSILEDTLTGFLLPPFHESIRKRQRHNPKFYFFDTGVARAAARSLSATLSPATFAFGRAFEHWVIIEAIRLASYRQPDFRFSYLRTKDDAEIDLIVERPGMPTALIEIKSTARFSPQELAPLQRLRAAFGKHEAFCLSRDPTPKKIDGIHALPWARGLTELGL